MTTYTLTNKEVLVKLDRIALYITEQRTLEPYQSPKQYFWWQNWNDAEQLIRALRNVVTT